MYRARVEKISGKKIYAGGKWLQCIGNKNFHVGELVYTDGRCAYGNFLEAQQPLVITASPEEGIPIVTTNPLFTFYKGKLKLIDKENTRSGFFINNKNKSYFIEDAYTFPPDEYVYQYNDNWGTKIEEEQACDLEGVLAANVDKAGNLFIIYIDGFNMTIRKNGNTLDTINLEELLEEAKNFVPQPEAIEIPEPDIPGQDESIDPVPKGPFVYYDTNNWVELKITHCFIEDENDWSVFLDFFIYKETTTWVLGGLIGSDYYDFESATRCYVNYYITNDGVTHDKPVSETHVDPLNKWALEWYERSWYWIIGREPDPKKKVPLQDGYYFKEEWTRHVIAYNELPNGTPIPVVAFYMKRIIFSPEDIEIFSGYFTESSSLILLCVRHEEPIIL